MKGVKEPVLLPAWIDQLATEEPQALWGEYPTSFASLDHGFTPITYAQFAKAVNGVASYLEKSLPNAQKGETLAYLAPNDPRCTISLVAAMKADFKLFLTSERNSMAAHVKLLDELRCTTLVTTDPEMAAIHALQGERKLKIIVLPSLKTLLHESQDVVKYSKEYLQIQNEAAFVVHTSGTTGLPKPMSITHCYLARAANNIRLLAPQGYTMISTITGNNRNILLLPLGHPAGVHFGLLNPFFNRTTVIIPRPNVPPTAETLLEMLKHTRADWAAVAPLTLETLSKNLPLLDEIAPRLDMILFSGGSLPKVFGDVLSKKMNLTSLLGSSESGPLPTMYHRNFDFGADWNYLQIHPAVNAIFDPLPGDVAELVFKRSPESEPYQTVFTLFPNLHEFRTRDIFARHSHYPDLWTHASRSDDIIVFLNGEKLNPATFESHISQHPNVSGVIMFGAQRFEAGLLIDLGHETLHSPPELARVLDSLWPSIEQANNLVPSYAQVSQSHICFTDVDKPILRSLKGTIRRKETLDLYESKIEEMYLDAESRWETLSPTTSKLTSEQVQNVVLSSIKAVPQLAAITESDDFFQVGLDSLQALQLAQTLRAKTRLQSVQPSMIYLHPTMARLSQAILESAHQTEVDRAEAEQSRERKIEQVLQEFTKKLDELEPASFPASLTAVRREDQVVLLTGSTGFIGSYLLDTLMKNESVNHIYCLNRSSDSAEVQAQRNAQNDRSLETNFRNVTFLTADFTDGQMLGLSSEVYEQVQQRVTLILHNAWPVNFNLPLSSFKPILGSLVAFSSFCARSPQQPSLAFVSSTSAAFNYQGSVEVPEEILVASSTPANNGYAESKHIAERLLDHASRALQLRCTVLRLGQIAGPQNGLGVWNDRDWVPALIRSSKYLKVIPDVLNLHGSDSINWLPIDELAAVITEVFLGLRDTNQGKAIRVYHLVNPARSQWRELLQGIVEVLDEIIAMDANKDTATKVEAVSPNVWLAKLRASANVQMEDVLIDENPALKLMGVWEEIFDRDGKRTLQRWSTVRAESASPRLAVMDKIRTDAMKRWTKGCFKAGT